MNYLNLYKIAKKIINADKPNKELLFKLDELLNKAIKDSKVNKYFKRLK